MKAILAYLNGVYTLMQGLYNQNAVARWIRRMGDFMSRRSGSKTMKDILLGVFLIALVGLLLDGTLYWTRKDQRERLERFFARFRRREDDEQP